MSRLVGSAADPRIGEATLIARPLPLQVEAVRAARVGSTATTIAILGGWGSGKTTAEALIALTSAIENPWRPAYGSSRPTTLLITETAKVLRDSLYAGLMRVLPEGIVTRERRDPAWDLELANGHLLALRSDAGAIEGLSCCTTIVDEVHKVRAKSDWINYAARARDPLARRTMVVAAGLPVDNGWLREEVDRPGDITRRTILMRTADNTALSPEYIATLLSRCSERERKTYLGAEWQTHEGAIYGDFSASVHVVRRPIDRSQPIHLGLDAGHRGAVIVGQMVSDGLLIVDEILPDSASAEDAVRQTLRRGWRLAPSFPGRLGSTICVDPKVSDDQRLGIQRACAEHGLSSVAIIQRQRGDPAEAVDYGIRAVQAALLSVSGETKLRISADIVPTERSILTGIPKYRWDPRTRQPIKDNVIDHALDALRYLVCQCLPSCHPVSVVDDPSRPR